MIFDKFLPQVDFSHGIEIIFTLFRWNFWFFKRKKNRQNWRDPGQLKRRKLFGFSRSTNSCCNRFHLISLAQQNTRFNQMRLRAHSELYWRAPNFQCNHQPRLINMGHTYTPVGLRMCLCWLSSCERQSMRIVWARNAHINQTLALAVNLYVTNDEWMIQIVSEWEKAREKEKERERINWRHIHRWKKNKPN